MGELDTLSECVLRPPMSFRPALGRRMAPDSLGGEADERGIGKVWMAGELKEVGGAEPEEYTDTLSSQSLLAPADETEPLRALSWLKSPGSFFTEVGEDEDLEDLPSAGLGPLKLCLRALLPALSSSNRKGRGRRWVRS